MAHLLGVHINDNKNLITGLTSIYGIGISHAIDICVKVQLNPKTRFKNLTENDINMISKELENNYVVESDLLKQNAYFLKRLLSIKSYRGLRHYSGLPVRGQRTKSNSKTQKRIGKRIKKSA